MAFTLPRLPPNVVTPQDMQIWWQQVVEAIEAEVGSLEASVQALAVAKEYMPTLPEVTINADYTGAVSPSNQLPKTILCTRFNGTTDVTALSTWSAVARIGGATATINSATGALQLTAITGSDIVDVTSVRDVEGVSITLTQPQQFIFATSAAPTGGGGGGGGGGSTESTSIFADINSTSHAEICALTVTAGAGGVVTLAAPLYVTTAEALPVGTFPVHGKWQWDSTGGGVWVDLAAEVLSSPHCSVATVSGEHLVYDGSLSVPDSKTGLTPTSSYNFRLMARSNVGTRVMSFYGTASAVGS
jgi:hypothetical protein